jgi:hypothetical protein
MYELLFPNSWPKNLGVAYTRANTAKQKEMLKELQQSKTQILTSKASQLKS